MSTDELLPPALSSGSDVLLSATGHTDSVLVFFFSSPKQNSLLYVLSLDYGNLLAGMEGV